jgi:hypothetical protein
LCATERLLALRLVSRGLRLGAPGGLLALRLIGRSCLLPRTLILGSGILSLSLC